MGLEPLTEETLDSSPAPPPHEDRARRRQPVKQEAGPHRTLNVPAPWSQTSQPPEP